MVCKHKPADLVRRLNIWAFLAEGDLDRGWSPLNQFGKFSFSNSLQTFVNLGGIDISLDDVQNRDVRSFPGCAANHDVLGLKQTAHDI